MKTNSRKGGPYHNRINCSSPGSFSINILKRPEDKKGRAKSHPNFLTVNYSIRYTYRTFYHIMNSGVVNNSPNNNVYESAKASPTVFLSLIVYELLYKIYIVHVNNIVSLTETLS